MTRVIPHSRNMGSGFWATMGQDAESAWPLAIQKISAATGESPEYVRAFLDDMVGSFFAASVQSNLWRGRTLAQSIDETVTSWMRWGSTDLPASRDIISDDLPLLTSFVRLCGRVEPGARM